VLTLSDTQSMFIQALPATDVRAELFKMIAGDEALARAVHYEEFGAREESEPRSAGSSTGPIMGRRKRVGCVPLAPDLLDDLRKADGERAVARRREK
jgi:hypothetical protein